MTDSVEIIEAQEWLNKCYPKEEREKVEEVIAESKVVVKGSLDLSDFPNLQKVFCPRNRITAINVSKCEKLQLLWCHENKITELDVSCCLNLKVLSCWKNSLVSLDVSQNKLLTGLFLFEKPVNYPKFRK
jgi:hypothetical protein